MHVPVGVEADGEDFWRLWLGEREFFFKTCVRWLQGNRHDAEDVLSKGALNAAEYMRHNPRTVQQFWPWMLRVLHNLCVDIQRGRARGAELQQHAPAEPTVLVGGAHGPPPDLSLLRREMATSIREAAAELPPHLYQVFALRFLDELPYDRISQALSITPQNARKRIQQVREILRASLRAFA
jgi:RNA polymerase sigma factor (sigma-70 family)